VELPLVPVEALCAAYFAPVGLEVLGVDGRGRALVRMPVVNELAPLEEVVRARLVQETREHRHRDPASLSETLRAYLIDQGLERYGAFLMDVDGKTLRVIDALAERRAVELRAALDEPRTGDGR
jgi:hypothetical protein